MQAWKTDVKPGMMMMMTVLRSHFPVQKPKLITYRDYKNYNRDDFRKEVNDIVNLYNDEDIDYNIFFNTFLDTFNRHAPKKQKHVRANQCNFMDTEINKAVMTRCKVKK